MMERSLLGHDLVIVDDLHLIIDVVEHYNYARSRLFNTALKALLESAQEREKQFIFAVDENDPPTPIRHRALPCEVKDFMPEDYECICGAYLPANAAGRIDFAKLHRFAPKLTAHQLRNTCVGVDREQPIDTEVVTEFLASQNMTSNVEIEEVAPVDWKDLKGVDDVIEALETKIAFPFDNGQIAADLNLKPKRGVLLAGPPGTGKTTIGRALAHRLRSKFFLIDGTVVAGSGDFYDEVGRIFDAAKQNAPAVIFIDDADVIFEGNKDPGFYRYLLTMLDGLHSTSVQGICVMMTAMEVSSLPIALLRSGRIELWLETRLPDAKAREVIFADKLAELSGSIAEVNREMLVSAAHGLTGADLKTVIEDGKLLYARDLANSFPLRPSTEYFLEAIDTVKMNRRRYIKPNRRPLGDTIRFGFQPSDLLTETCRKSHREPSPRSSGGDNVPVAPAGSFHRAGKP